MRDVVTMWKDTRMIVLTAVIAAVYAAVLIPFKPIPIIPGFTEIRPANALPIVFSLMFGPAAAWGAGLGNLIGDFFGTLGLGSVFGFLGNFLYGLIPYKIWGVISRTNPVVKKEKKLVECLPQGAALSCITSSIIGWLLFLFRLLPFSEMGNVIIVLSFSLFGPVLFCLAYSTLAKFFIVVLIASMACGVVIGWGVDLLGMVPFSALGNIITLNNFVVSIVLGLPLLHFLYPRIKGWGLIYEENARKKTLHGQPLRILGFILLVIGCVGGLVIGNLISIGVYKAGVFGKGFLYGTKGALGIGAGLCPLIVTIAVACLLL